MCWCQDIRLREQAQPAGGCRKAATSPELSLPMTLETSFKRSLSPSFPSEDPYVFHNHFSAHSCVLKSTKLRNISLFLSFLTSLLSEQRHGAAKATMVCDHLSFPLIQPMLSSPPCARGEDAAAGGPGMQWRPDPLPLAPMLSPICALGWQWCPPAPFLLTQAGIGER